MAYQNCLRAIPLSTLNAAALGAAYQEVNTGGLDYSCVLLRINNGGNTAITISFDGTTDHEYLTAGQDLLINSQTNSSPNNYACQFKRGTIIYVKGTAGAGTISLSGYYQPIGV